MPATYPGLAFEEIARGWPHRSAWLIAAICALVAAGCEEEARNVRKTARDQGPGIRRASPSTSTSKARRQRKPKPPAKPVWAYYRPAHDRHSRREQGAQAGRSTGRIDPESWPKTRSQLQGNAYVSIIGRTSVLKIQQAVDLYHAANDRYPKDLDEFMTEIIKANNIALPQLPPYQEYGYDEKEHKLIILEYPDLKN